MLSKWCEVTSCNGIIDWYESRRNKAQFCFWTIVIFCMLGCTVFFTYRTIQGYVDTPTVTNVAMTRQSILELPHVMICYNGGLNVKVINASFDTDFIHTFQSALTDNAGSVDLSVVETVMKEFMEKNQVNEKDFVKMHSFQCEDLLLPSQSPDQPEPICNRCSGVVRRLEGNCYIYEHNRTQFWPGSSGGMKLKLRSPKESYASTYPAKASQLDLSNSFMLYLERKFGEVSTDRSFSIPSNALVSMTLNTKRYVRISDCDSRPSESTSNSCFNECWMNETEKVFKCQPLMFSRFSSNSTVDICSVIHPEQWGLDEKGFAKVQECQKTCLPICDEWIFETAVTYGQREPNPESNITTSVNIGYNSMQYTKIDNVAAFTIDMAISNVGGQAGLWLGVSIVTIIQALYYLVLSAIRLCNRNQIKSTKNSDNALAYDQKN